MVSLLYVDWVSRGGLNGEALHKSRSLEPLTGYDYQAGSGLSYRFGSILNNIVNPRL